MAVTQQWRLCSELGSARPPAVRTVSGPARLGRKTKVLVKHLMPGDVAVIDHLDIDRVSAEELITAGAAAVLNCRASTSGSYPNLGPQLLVEAGVLLVDLPDDALFGVLSEGAPITVPEAMCSTRAVWWPAAKCSIWRGCALRPRLDAARWGRRWSASPTTPSSTCARSASCWRARSRCRASPPTSAIVGLVVVRAWTISAICARCGLSSAMCGR